VSELAGAASDAGTTPDALALAVVLSQPWADVVLSGAASADEMESNLTALTLELDSQRIGELLAAVHQDSSSYWRERSGLSWN
jgi:aryl-alcohol dehydrogenase-like predicted oxidoreductase